MVVDIDDIIKLLQELEHNKIELALVPNDLVSKQYALIGSVEGVRSAIRKLKNHYEREDF